MGYISTQELQNASMDARTLERFANGRVGDSNINRTGNDVSNLATLVDSVIGLSVAESYLTLQQLQLNGIQPAGSWAVVLNDPDPSNNGNWVSDGVQWVFAGLQPSQFDDVDFLYDFRTNTPNEPSYVVTDEQLNILAPADSEGIEFIADFHSDQAGEAAYVVVDGQFNVLTPVKEPASEYRDVPDSPIWPNQLSARSDVYFDFNVLTRQNDLRAAIYNASAHTLASSHALVYAFYDALVTAYPDRFAMEVLGADALGNEIRQYSYTPQLLNSGTSSNTQWPVSARRPAKMVITTGVHGDEREAIVDVMAVMREVLEEPYFNEQIMLLSQARIVIVPCINPSGIDTRNRYNHNDVDINRNAPSQWSSTATKPGNAPLDQLETQIACSLPSLHPDADIFIDRHNYALTLNRSAWFAVIDETLFPSVKRLALHMQAFLPRDYAWLQGYPVRIGKNDGGTTARDWFEASGKPAVLIETVRETPGVDIFVSRQYSLYVTRKSLFDLLSLYI